MLSRNAIVRCNGTITHELYEVRYAYLIEELDHTIKSTNGNTVNITLKDANVSKVSKDRVLAKTQATDYNLSGIT